MVSNANIFRSWHVVFKDCLYRSGHRVCCGLGQHLAIPLHHIRKWWGRLCPDLFGVHRLGGAAHHVCRNCHWPPRPDEPHQLDSRVDHRQWGLPQVGDYWGHGHCRRLHDFVFLLRGGRLDIALCVPLFPRTHWDRSCHHRPQRHFRRLAGQCRRTDLLAWLVYGHDHGCCRPGR